MDRSFKKLACMCQSMVDLSSGEIDLSYGTIECMLSSDNITLSVSANRIKNTMTVVLIAEDTKTIEYFANYGHGKMTGNHHVRLENELAWAFVEKLYKEVIR